MSTLADFRTMVLEVYKRDDKATELDRAVNETYGEMLTAVGPRKLEDQIYKPTVIRREEYPIPDTVLRINHPIRLLEPGTSNRGGLNTPLKFLTKDEYDNIEPNPNASTIIPGRPWAYTFWKNSILLTDIPDKVYYLEVNIGGEPTKLTAPTDASILSWVWDETVKAGSLARMFALIRNNEEMAKWQAIYLNGMIGEDGGMTGGLKLLKRLNEDLTKAQLIVQNRDF